MARAMAPGKFIEDGNWCIQGRGLWPISCDILEIKISNISWNIEAGEGLGHEKSKFFFAGANFIALRRRGSYFKCLVAWLHRREIAPAGAIVHTNELVQSVFFRPLGRIFVIEKDEFRKSGL